MSRFFHFRLTSLLLLAMGCVHAQAQTQALPQAIKAPASAAASVPAGLPALATPPNWDVSHSFESLGRASDTLLLGTRNTDQFEFTLRRDRIASQAGLQLEYTPSPALLPTLSHLRIYLNDVLMSVVPIEKEHLGKKTVRQVALDPRLVSDFNRVRLEFVGHYTDICEEPSNSALWVNVSRVSQVSLKEQALIIKNDLAYFPVPFFDSRGHGLPSLNMVFAGQPTLGEQRAAGVLASYFGSQAAWRGTQFPVLFDQLPAATAERPAGASIVFATNSHRPAFMADLAKYPAVEAPVVQMLDSPVDRYSKVLLVMGRDEADLLTAVQALALGGDLLRGDRVVIDKVQQLQPRKPYDAPNWMATDRPVRFAELIKYPEQLRASGLQPQPISVEMNLPPDLFVWRNQGIPLQARYRYTPPPFNDGSRLNISLNNEFISSLPLQVNSHDQLEELRLAVLNTESANVNEKVSMPALKVGDRNTLQFKFSFTSTGGGAQRDRCQTSLPIDAQAVIDDQSTIDLSGYHHYMAMPDLSAFARSGFPYSRMADLSETLVVLPRQPNPLQLSTYLEALAGISARSGLPAMKLQVSDDWEQASQLDADLLVLGSFAPDMRDNRDMNLLLDRSRDWLLQSGNKDMHSDANPPSSLVQVSAQGPMAAIVGLQSPFHAQRSIVALLATQDTDFQLLRETLNDSGKLNAVAGSVALIRDSGVYSQLVGERYYIGSLPWWELLWFKLSEHPVLLAFMAVFGVLLTSLLVMRALQWAARRRLAYGE